MTNLALRHESSQTATQRTPVRHEAMARKKTGKETAQKKTGRETAQKKTENETTQKKMGNNTAQKKMGNNTRQRTMAQTSETRANPAPSRRHPPTDLRRSRLHDCHYPDKSTFPVLEPRQPCHILLSATDIRRHRVCTSYLREIRSSVCLPWMFPGFIGGSLWAAFRNIC